MFHRGSEREREILGRLRPDRPRRSACASRQHRCGLGPRSLLCYYMYTIIISSSIVKLCVCIYIYIYDGCQKTLYFICVLRLYRYV